MGLLEYANQRDALLRRIAQVLEVDPRVQAAWLSGSFGRGEADEWSDLDLHLAIDDADFGQFLAERESLYRRVGHPILIQHDMVQDSSASARFQLVLYRGPIEVDWNIGPVSRAVRPLGSLLLIERSTIAIATPPPLNPAERRSEADHWLTFFWVLAPIAIKYSGRGELDRAVKQIDLLRTAFIALWRLVWEPAGPNPALVGANRPLEQELDAQVPRFGSRIDPRSTLDMIDELCQKVQFMHPALIDLRVVVPTEIPAEVAALRGIAAEVVGLGDAP